MGPGTYIAQFAARRRFCPSATDGNETPGSHWPHLTV
jgi:hypothetical protein